jgi:hypothetical protein
MLAGDAFAGFPDCYLAWPRFECRSEIPDLHVLVNQPRYTSQVRMTQIARNNVHSLLHHKLNVDELA